MRICYIKQAKNIDEYINYKSKIKKNFMKNIVMRVKKIFSIITLKPIGDGVIFLIPYKKKNEIKLADKIIGKLKYYNIDSIVIDKNLQSDNFKNRLYENNVNILDGRWLFEFLLIDILKYISNFKKEKLENLEVTIMVNELNEIIINNIYVLAEKIKRVNIVTNNMEKFKNIENKLYQEKGIIITVNNNKRKSLANAKIILNIDFPEELFNNYKINTKAIVVNIGGKIKINSKIFTGININYYQIKLKDEIMKKFIENNMVDDFDKNILYESSIYGKNQYVTIRNKMIKDGVEITGLIGNKGKINEKEFEIKM